MIGLWLGRTVGQWLGHVEGVAPPAVQTDQPSGGYGFGAYDRTLRRRKRELEEQIAALEEHLAQEQKVPRETIRLQARVREYAAPLPPVVRRAVNRAVRVQTHKAFEHAERVIEAFEREEEDFAVLLALALH